MRGRSNSWADLHVLIPVLAAAAALAGCTGIPVRTDQNAQLLASVHCQSVAWAGGFKGASPLRDGIANPLNEAGCAMPSPPTCKRPAYPGG